MNDETRRSAIAAAIIIAVFAAGAYFMPSMMLAAGEFSPWAAAIVAVVFVGAFFAVFWLRARRRGK